MYLEIMNKPELPTKRENLIRDSCTMSTSFVHMNQELNQQSKFFYFYHDY